MVGSLIKNLGGGIAPNGGYICGKKELIHLCSERLNVAGEAKLVGPSMNMNKLFLQGIYMAPSVVASALKTAILTSKVLSELGYNVSPKYNEKRVDIVESIIFKDREKLILELRFGLGGKKPQTQHEIAEMLGISRSYVSRIETKAINKLATEIKE